MKKDVCELGSKKKRKKRWRAGKNDPKHDAEAKRSFSCWQQTCIRIYVCVAGCALCKRYIEALKYKI